MSLHILQDFAYDGFFRGAKLLATPAILCSLIAQVERLRIKCVWII